MMLPYAETSRLLLCAVVALHDQFQLRLEHHHLLGTTNAECGHPSELEVTGPVVREGLLMARLKPVASEMRRAAYAA